MNRNEIIALCAVALFAIVTIVFAFQFVFHFGFVKGLRTKPELIEFEEVVHPDYEEAMKTALKNSGCEGFVKDRFNDGITFIVLAPNDNSILQLGIHLAVQMGITYSEPLKTKQ